MIAGSACGRHMRLRRSDFGLWDYSKRRMWARLPADLQDGYRLAWWLQRAQKARAVRELLDLAPWIEGQVAIGVLMAAAQGRHGHVARSALRLIAAVTPPAERALHVRLIEAMV